MISLTLAAIAEITGAGLGPFTSPAALARSVVPGADDAVAALGNLLAPGDVVLVKASRAVGLERVALALTGEAAQ